MSDSRSGGGCLALTMFMGTIAAWIGAGAVTWNLIQPDSFGRALLFLFVWGILGKILDLIVGAIAIGLARLFE